MADKALSESAWKAFAKGKGYKDGPLVHALGHLDAAADEPADVRLQALAGVEEVAQALRKANSDDKPLGAQLKEMDRALASERKSAQQAAQDARGAAEEDEKERNPAALTTQLVPLLRLVRKGDVMQVLICSAGRDVSLVLSKRPVPPARRKMLMQYLGVTSGAKYFAGECLWEDNALTFALARSSTGMGKKLKAAVLKQAGLRLNVKVKGDSEGSTGKV